MFRIGNSLPCKVINFLSHERYTLLPLDDGFTRKTAAIEIAEVWNEEAIYQSLFIDLMNGRPYCEQDAAWYISWAQEGWRKAAYFVFLLLAPNGSVSGGIDIKSADIESGEIGYWLSCEHSGVMTNAVSTVAEIAAEAGYRRLHAWVQDWNTKSIGVLNRTGFYQTERWLRDGRLFVRFERELQVHEREGPPGRLARMRGD